MINTSNNLDGEDSAHQYRLLSFFFTHKCPWHPVIFLFSIFFLIKKKCLSFPTVPTLVAFLKELESPYDVHDYIRSCLGETLEAKEFAKQFLERRAKYKASQRQQVSGHWPSTYRVIAPCSLEGGNLDSP